MFKVFKNILYYIPQVLVQLAKEPCPEILNTFLIKLMKYNIGIDLDLF